MKNKRCRIDYDKLREYLKANGYTICDVAEEMQVRTRTLRFRLMHRWGFKQLEIMRFITFVGVENAFKLIVYNSEKEKQKVFYETFVKPIEIEMGYKWEK